MHTKKLIASCLTLILILLLPIGHAITYEDFTTYTEVDPNARITVTSTRINVTDLTRAEDAYVYTNETVSGDFEQLLDIHPVSCTADWGLYYVWGLANAIGPLNSLGLDSNNLVCYSVNRHSDDSMYVSLREYYDGTAYSNGTLSLAWDTTYYLTIFRLSNVLYAQVYSDANRTILVSEDSLPLHTIDTYNHVYATSSDGYSGTQAFTGYVENLYFPHSYNMTYYHTSGGSICDHANGTTTSYLEGSVVLIFCGTYNASYIFLNITYTSGSSVTNPHNVTVTQAETVWCYFAPVPVGNGDAEIPWIYGLLLLFPMLLVMGLILLKRR